MPYYHNPMKKIVYSVPDKPLVTEKITKPTKRNKRPRREEWFVQAEIEIIRADNFIEPGTRRWHYKTSDILYEHYPPTDSEEQVVSWFRMNCLRPKDMVNEIPEEEYRILKKLYEEEAEKNPPTQS